MVTGNPEHMIFFRRSALAVFLIIFAAGALIYSNSLLSPFYFDDLERIIENPHIRLTRLTGGQLADIPHDQPAGRILTMVTFAVNYYFHQYQVTGYRLVNIFIHIITAWLVFCLSWQTLRLCGREPFWGSLMAGLLWMAQPTHTQSVTYIIQRMNSLATMFYLLAVICYVQARTRQRQNAGPNGTILFFTGFGLAGLLGLISKETTATLPVFIFLYEWFFFQHLNTAWLKQQARWLGIMTALCGLIAIIYLGEHPLERISAPYANKMFTPAERLLTQPRVILYYLSLLLYPHPDRLTLCYDFPASNTLTDPSVTVLAICALTALLSIGLLAAKKDRLLSFAVLWFLGNLAIESSVIGLELAFEHRLYLPSVFPVIAATAYLMSHIDLKPLGIFILGSMIICSGFWTYQRNITWQDRITFWRDGKNKAPGLTRPRNDYGLALAEAGDLEAARVEFEKAIALSGGEKGSVFNNLGTLYYQTGDPVGAGKQFQRAIQTHPTFAKAFINLGIIKTEEKNLEAAIQLLETAILLDPGASEAHNALGKAHYESGRPAPAIRHCLQALNLDPKNINAENNLGAILIGIGRADQALPHLIRVLDLSPDHLEANINIGITYDKLDNPVMAVFHLFRAVFLDPDYPTSRAELGLFLLRRDKLQDAHAQLEKTLALQPDFLKARIGLASVLEKLGLKEEAIVQYRRIIADDPDNAAARGQLGLLSGEKFDGQ